MTRDLWFRALVAIMLMLLAVSAFSALANTAIVALNTY